MKMETDRNDECRKYKWSSLATNLLVSIWCHDLIQNQLKVSPRNQPIWESIARYMSRKGFSVTGLQCKTRIKNMLYSYHEAVKKNDPSLIEPYYNIFKDVLSNKGIKKTEMKAEKLKHSRTSEEANNESEVSISSERYDSNEYVTQGAKNSAYEVEFIDVKNLDSEVTDVLSSHTMKKIEKIILKAIDTQTKAITNAIQMQSKMIEKLLLAERERLETIMASERESRRQLETRLDKLLTKLETSVLPQVTYMGTLVEPLQIHPSHS